MTITRRQFGKTVTVSAGTLALGMTTMGLSCNTVFQDIENYVPIGLAAFQEIISLISPAEASLFAPVIAIVKAAFADLETVITQYQNAPASNKATLLGKIETAITIVINNLNQFWNDLNIPDGTLASTIVGVLQIIISTLAAFLPLIGGTLLLPKKFAKPIPVVPRSKSQLGSKTVKSDINAVFTKYGYSNHIY